MKAIRLNLRSECDSIASEFDTLAKHFEQLAIGLTDSATASRSREPFEARATNALARMQRTGLFPSLLDNASRWPKVRFGHEREAQRALALNWRALAMGLYSDLTGGIGGYGLAEESVFLEEPGVRGVRFTLPGKADPIDKHKVRCSQDAEVCRRLAKIMKDTSNTLRWIQPAGVLNDEIANRAKDALASHTEALSETIGRVQEALLARRQKECRRDREIEEEFGLILGIGEEPTDFESIPDPERARLVYEEMFERATKSQSGKRPTTERALEDIVLLSLVTDSTLHVPGIIPERWRDHHLTKVIHALYEHAEESRGRSLAEVLWPWAERVFAVMEPSAESQHERVAEVGHKRPKTTEVVRLEAEAIVTREGWPINRGHPSKKRLCEKVGCHHGTLNKAIEVSPKLQRAFRDATPQSERDRSHELEDLIHEQAKDMDNPYA